MLVDANHRPANGAALPTLCAYHAGRLLAAAPVVDPEVLGAELLDDIVGFTTADEVNFFLGISSDNSLASPSRVAMPPLSPTSRN
jgi:hypothetical protein